MEYQELMNANATAKTTTLKKKDGTTIGDYVDVNERVRIFRLLFPNGSITTDILMFNDGAVTMKATVIDENGQILATGIAHESESSSNLNKTSFVENCETSAVGRALGFLGIGIQSHISSTEETISAVNKQSQESKNVPNKVDERMILTLQEKIKRKGCDVSMICKNYKVEKLEDMTVKNYKNAMERLEEYEDVEN